MNLAGKHSDNLQLESQVLAIGVIEDQQMKKDLFVEFVAGLLVRSKVKVIKSWVQLHQGVFDTFSRDVSYIYWFYYPLNPLAMSPCRCVQHVFFSPSC